MGGKSYKRRKKSAKIIAHKKPIHFQNLFLIGIIGVLPMYPALGNIEFFQPAGAGGGSSDYDSSSIISSVNGEDFDVIESGSLDFIEPVMVMEDVRDVAGVNNVVEYIVEYGDSFSIIADKFQVSIDSILWANSLYKNTVLKPGQILKIPPVSGLIHTVAKDETIESLAKKYKIDAEKIIAQNNLIAANISEGETLVIPGAKKVVPKPKPKPVYSSPKNYSFSKQVQTKIVEDSGDYTYKLTYQPEGRKAFVWGNCTYFVAQYKKVTWRGNAKDWYANAQASGAPVGSVAQPGAIIVFHGSGYNRRYGHVGIVVDVKGEDIIIKDMNFRRLNEVTTRVIKRNDSAITGYIYVE